MKKHEKPMRDKLKMVGRVIRASGAARFYHDGDGAGFVWRWWSPVAWVLAPLSFIVACLAIGIPDAWRDRHDFGFGMKPWFIQNPDRLFWD
ncbi:hypothetical protein [Limoniibacter endophyticus]|uniref:Uncharacterized protein n=1 Tax=Limoniibacter endophyticus TaxID=1565040 RepID=A0A8J3DFY2_9HYPH|nr:hypothetical protein [Limoniibacter endophyticus]GHC61731.1 hypothetical protein GCM10010136_02460 [Limoniibacter endophyticus]